MKFLDVMIFFLNIYINHQSKKSFLYIMHIHGNPKTIIFVIYKHYTIR